MSTISALARGTYDKRNEEEQSLTLEQFSIYLSIKDQAYKQEYLKFITETGIEEAISLIDMFYILRPIEEDSLTLEQFKELFEKREERIKPQPINYWYERNKTKFEKLVEKARVVFNDEDGFKRIGYIDKTYIHPSVNEKSHYSVNVGGKLYDVSFNAINIMPKRDEFEGLEVSDRYKKISTSGLISLLHSRFSSYASHDYDQIRKELNSRPHLPSKKEGKMIRAKRK